MKDLFQDGESDSSKDASSVAFLSLLWKILKALVPVLRLLLLIAASYSVTRAATNTSHG